MYSLATVVQTVEESKALSLRRGPRIIISARGMLAGGRVLHHLRAFESDAPDVIPLPGFQPGGKNGAALATGGWEVRVREHPERADPEQPG